MSHRHLPGLDSASEHTSSSSVIPLIPTIQISETDRMRYDGMIGNSDDSNDSLVQLSELLGPRFETILQGQTCNATVNAEETKVTPLISTKYQIDNDKNMKQNLPCHKDSVDISGISSLMDISNLSENIPSNLSIDVQQLFYHATNQEIEIATAMTDSDVGDFSPSDESDFDPKKAGYNSDESLEKSLDDEYYDDPVIEQLNKKRKRKTERLQGIMTEENGFESSQNLPNKEGESFIEENPDFGGGIVEKDPKKIETKRKWDRRNACFYCQEMVTNYTRHLFRNHPNELEVIQYKAINDNDPKIRKLRRQKITNKLRNKGNFLHNSKVSFDRDSNLALLPSKRNNQGTSSPSSYATCKICLGTFKRSSFFRHLKNCKTSENLVSSTRKALFNHSITIVPNTANASIELKEKILSHLRSDEISLVVKNDPLILAYGTRLLKKKKERRSRKAICSKMRDLATLLNLLRKKDSTIESLTDAIDPEKYEILVSAIKEMCGFDEQTGTVKVISIPARMRPAVLGCIEILYTNSIMGSESSAFKDAYKKKLDDFKSLIEINWEWEISSNAEKSRKRNQLTKETVMPLDIDIKTVMEKIHNLETKYANKLREDKSVLNYELLCKITIAHIIMLDRKRSGDVAEAELTFYINRKNEEVPEKVLETLTVEQRKCIKDLDVFQIPGKRTRAVPILLTKVMRENIDLIIACREDLQISNSNKYLFARVGTQEPFDGGKCLDMIKTLCNLKRPEMITSTGMRHHIATMSQIHSKQNSHYTEQLAGFLGHDLSVHAQNYRLPMQVLQKAVVGSQLMEYENANKEKKIKKVETITSQSYQEVEPLGMIEEERRSSKNKKKTKSKCPSGSSDSGDDSPLKKRSKISHRKWSDDEIKAVKKYFQSYINRKVNPGKNKCMEVLNKEPVLQSRTWMQLNTYVNNIYKKK